ncbi:uncharacterized protein CEXT_98401 [Caerostris extrusa]|uniref:Uncharacterized protein n=1 Tax=Caerostris extrusa TaxID=172846 RepID=A0AAV4SWT5_CAEEX|nr:uncharacterized protein CEXT_98401 [Caerostris extrusa]
MSPRDGEEVYRQKSVPIVIWVQRDEYERQTQRDFKAIMIKYSVLLLVAVVAAQAFVCPPNICNFVSCKNLDDCDVNNGYKIREKGSVCQCCDLCVKILGENENCIPPSVINRDQIFIMMKYIVLLVVAVAVTEALFVCPKNYCDNIECENLSACSESNGYKIKEKGSWCQCCDTCIKILGENERCMPIALGMISKAECAEGLVCPVGVGRCVKEN